MVYTFDMIDDNLDDGGEKERKALFKFVLFVLIFQIWWRKKAS